MSTKGKDSVSLTQKLTQFTEIPEIHYFTVYAKAKPRSEPLVVARLGLPDFAELIDLLILYKKRIF